MFLCCNVCHCFQGIPARTVWREGARQSGTGGPQRLLWEVRGPGAAFGGCHGAVAPGAWAGGSGLVSSSPAVELLPPCCLSELSWVVRRETRSPRATSLHRPGGVLVPGEGTEPRTQHRLLAASFIQEPIAPEVCGHHEQGTGPVHPGFHHRKTLLGLGCLSCW